MNIAFKLAGSLTFILLGVVFMIVSQPGQAGELGSESYIVLLRNQDQITISQEIKDQYQPRLKELSQELQQSARALGQTWGADSPDQPAVPINPVESLPPGFLKMQAQITNEMDGIRQQMRMEILEKSAASRNASQQVVSQFVVELGGEVTYAFQSLNTLVIRIPADSLPALQAMPEVQEVFADQVLEAQMDISADAIDAEKFWNLGFTGNGVDVAVVDTGVDRNHPALATQNIPGKRCLTTAQTIYPLLATKDPTTDDVNGHGTHIAGTIASTDTTYRGIAYGLGTLLNAKAGFAKDYSDNGAASMYLSDAMSCIDWALTDVGDTAEVFSFSFGGATSSDDGDFERFWDAVVSQMEAVAVIAAGNNGSATKTLNSPCIAYNAICVANINDQNTVARSDDTIASSSSRGPTIGGRKKPDLSASGTNVHSTDNSWETAADFIDLTGTSMATPHISGVAALLIGRGVYDPMAVKALLINNAQDKGTTGWDNAYGWGYIDMGNVNAHIDDYALNSIAPHPAYQLYAGPALSGETATLVWNRRAVYQADAFPSTFFTLTDLDLIAYRQATNATMASSLSGIDNVEQVSFSSADAQVVLKVKINSMAIAGANQEAYALATGNGFSLSNGPALQILVTGNGSLSGPAGTLIDVSLSLTNLGDLKAHDIQLSLELSPGLVLVSGPVLSASLPSLAVGETSELLNWQLEKTMDSVQSVIVQATSNSYGETFSTRVGYFSNLYLPLVITG